MNPIKNIVFYLKLVKASAMARRYFSINFFDGVMTILGVLFAGYVAGAKPNIILHTGLGVGIAMLISGFSGSYLTETAEKRRELKALEKALLRKLEKSLLHRRNRTAAFLNALTNGFAPFIASLIVMAPYIIGSVKPISHAVIFSFSLGISAILLFFLGVYLGKISKGNAIFFGLKMVAAGCLTAIAIIAFEHI